MHTDRVWDGWARMAGMAGMAGLGFCVVRATLRLQTELNESLGLNPSLKSACKLLLRGKKSREKLNICSLEMAFVVGPLFGSVGLTKRFPSATVVS